MACGWQWPRHAELRAPRRSRTLATPQLMYSDSWPAGWRSPASLPCCRCAAAATYMVRPLLLVGPSLLWASALRPFSSSSPCSSRPSRAAARLPSCSAPTVALSTTTDACSAKARKQTRPDGELVLHASTVQVLAAFCAAGVCIHTLHAPVQTYTAACDDAMQLRGQADAPQAGAAPAGSRQHRHTCAQQAAAWPPAAPPPAALSPARGGCPPPGRAHPRMSWCRCSQTQRAGHRKGGRGACRPGTSHMQLR